MMRLAEAIRSVMPRAVAAAVWAGGLLVPCVLCAQGPPGAPIAPSPQQLSGFEGPEAPRVARLQPIEGGQTIAQIGNQVVLASELMWQVNQRIVEAESQGEISRDVAQQLREQVLQNLQNRLAGVLDVKLIINDLRTQIPPEGIAQAEKHFAGPFEERYVPALVEDFGVASRGDVDARLRQYGTSLAQLRQEFLDNQLARMWLDEKTSGVPTITRDELLREYETHLEEYSYPAKARWQELMVRFDRFGWDRQAAYRALVEMGNQVLENEAGRGGAPFEDVAKKMSHGFTATQGGLHDWTDQGSLVAEQIDQALFSLPVGGRPSQILTSNDGYHIVRVLERKPAGRTPFEQAQADIRERLLNARKAQKQRAYLERLRKEVRIWTIYSGPTTADEFLKSLASSANS